MRQPRLSGVMEGRSCRMIRSMSFEEEDINVYTLALKVTNADGVDVKNINVSVIPEEKPLLFFDNARYVLPSMLDKAITMTCPIGKNVVLAPIKFAISDQAVYEWKVDGAVQSGQTSVCFDFKPSVEGKNVRNRCDSDR